MRVMGPPLQPGVGILVYSDPKPLDSQSGRPETSAKLRVALEKAGVEFIAENGGGAGVRMKKRAKRGT